MMLPSNSLMKKIIVFCFLLTSFIGNAQTTTEISESFLNKMIRQQFDSCQTYFDTSITDKINAGMMASMWERIPQFVGEYKSYGNIRTEKADTIDVVLIQVAFEKTKLDLKFAYNRYKKIIGIFFIPPKSKNAYNLPPYYDLSKQYESKLAVKTGTYSMPGILCVPNNITNPPVVILLAGSGPNDKDESVGPNRPLKDIALGLASNGIASFRYDKRTLTHGKDLDINKTGLNEEVIDDALSAIKILRAHALTKESKIFIAGHSLGAMCVPYIASKSKDISGVIMLAGPARPLEDLVLEQYTYLASLDSAAKDSKKDLAEIKRQVDLVKDPKALKNAAAKDLPLGAPSYYWQSIKKYDQVKTAKKVKQPILVLNGERDYQVPMIDFNIWKKELESNPKNKFKSYASLNHLFISGKGVPNPDEYDESGNIDGKVITDIVEFVKSIN